MTEFRAVILCSNASWLTTEFIASASSRLKRGDKLLACLSAPIRRFASWKLATTFLRSQEIRLEDALGDRVV
jgi:hypothetical protein